VRVCLSAANNSSSDPDMFVFFQFGAEASTCFLPLVIEKTLNLTGATTFYLNIQTASGGVTAIGFYGNLGTTMIIATPAFF
jgi:hypothetical protein